MRRAGQEPAQPDALAWENLSLSIGESCVTQSRTPKLVTPYPPPLKGNQYLMTTKAMAMAMAPASPPPGDAERDSSTATADERTRKERRRLWRAYLLLAALRAAASAALLGMIHPDEFFQSQEVMARHALEDQPRVRRELFLPWEFRLPTPNRSVLFPYAPRCSWPRWIAPMVHVVW
jgi:hypothetical protein